MAPLRNTGGAIVAAAISMAAILTYRLQNPRPKYYYSVGKFLSSKKKKSRTGGVIDAIGNTPLIRINSLSEATGCEILAKAEFLNPGGSVKDRIAVKIIEETLLMPTIEGWQIMLRDTK